MDDPVVSNTSSSRSWLAMLRIYMRPTSLRMLSLGFSAGLPLLLVLGTLSFRLRESGIDRTTIGFLSWIGLAYGLKWIWAPLVDRLAIPGLTSILGRRRSWLLLAQLAVAAGLIGMAWADPAKHLQALIGFALMVAFASATQDIALDAFRIESAASEQQAALAAMYQTGYRLAMIWAGAGVLWLAARFDNGGESAQFAWTAAYLAMSASMLVGIITVLFSAEPAKNALHDIDAEQLVLAQSLQARGMSSRSAQAIAWFKSAALGPFIDFGRRYRWQALLLLALIATYRISDVVMGIMANPFYVDLGYSKDEVAAVSKIYGVVMTLTGAFVGGAMALRWGVMRVLLLGAVLSAASNLLYAWLATRGHDVQGLIFVISADNLSGGIASAAFIAYLSSLTNIAYSATQYAILSSVMLLLPKLVAGFSGVYVDAYGYTSFFIGTALLGVPVLLLVILAGRVHARRLATGRANHH